jgi:hypothetical protein
LPEILAHYYALRAIRRVTGNHGPGMMLRRLKTIRLGAWLGVLALAVQLYLPIHLVHRVEAVPGSAAAPAAVHHHSTVHAVADQSHHDNLPGGQPGHAHEHCPLCSMLHAAAAITLADGVELHHPILQGTGSIPVPRSHESASASPASYASRAPPASLG